MRFLRHNTTASAFSRWREYRFDSVNGKKALLWRRDASLKGTSDSGGRRVSRDGCKGAFSKWMEYTTERQNKADQAATSLAHWMNQSMSRVFEKWIAYVDQRQRRTILIQNAISHWEQNTFAKVMLHIEETICHRSAFQVLLRWMEYVSAEQEKREMACRCLQRMSSRKMTMTLYYWREVAEYRASLRQIQRECHVRVRSKMLTSAFAVWRDITEWKIYRKHV